MPPTEPPAAALGRFYDLLRATGDRRGFGFGGRRRVRDVVGPRAARPATSSTSRRARASVDGDVLGGLVLYRHGRRLSTAHSADRAERRHDHPGAMHLLRWRAIELALAERRTEMDLGGVDVAGRPPSAEPGEPTYGLYEHKQLVRGDVGRARGRAGARRAAVALRSAGPDASVARRPARCGRGAGAS